MNSEDDISTDVDSKGKLSSYYNMTYLGINNQYVANLVMRSGNPHTFDRNWLTSCIYDKDEYYFTRKLRKKRLNKEEHKRISQMQDYYKDQTKLQDEEIQQRIENLKSKEFTIEENVRKNSLDQTIFRPYHQNIIMYDEMNHAERYFMFKDKINFSHFLVPSWRNKKTFVFILQESTTQNIFDLKQISISEENWANFSELILSKEISESINLDFMLDQTELDENNSDGRDLEENGECEENGEIGENEESEENREDEESEESENEEFGQYGDIDKYINLEDDGKEGDNGEERKNSEDCDDSDYSESDSVEIIEENEFRNNQINVNNHIDGNNNNHCSYEMNINNNQNDNNSSFIILEENWNIADYITFSNPPIL